MIRVMVVLTSWMVRTCLRWEGPVFLLKDGDSRSPFKTERSRVSWTVFTDTSTTIPSLRYTGTICVPCQLGSAAPEHRSWSAGRLSADGAETHRTEWSTPPPHVCSHLDTPRRHWRPKQTPEHVVSGVRLSVWDALPPVWDIKPVLMLNI